MITIVINLQTHLIAGIWLEFEELGIYNRFNVRLHRLRP